MLSFPLWKIIFIRQALSSTSQRFLAIPSNNLHSRTIPSTPQHSSAILCTPWYPTKSLALQSTALHSLVYRTLLSLPGTPWHYSALNCTHLHSSAFTNLSINCTPWH